MLVIISDIHLTDGTSGQTIKSGAFEAFRERIRDMAFDASYRSDGLYKPIERIELLLLGDILDVIRSSIWCEGDLRPWSNVSSPRFPITVRTINDAILANNTTSVAILKSLSDYISVPKADKGKPTTSKRDSKEEYRQPVEVKTFYMVGNHDWFYHLEGPAYDQMRATVVTQLGLANDPTKPFPHDPSESPAILQTLQAHRVFARHGDIYDSNNFDGDRNASSLGDAVVVELVNRFPLEVSKRLGNELPKECVLGLREIDNVRPQAMIPTWVDGVLKNTCKLEQQKKVKKVWNELVDQFLDVPFVKQHAAVLKWGLKLSTGLSLAIVSEIIRKLKLKTEGDFCRNAFRESAFNDTSASFIVCGHTHHYEIVPLRVAKTNAGTVEQVYINSGTWRAVHDPAIYRPDDEQFVGYHVLSYLAFFRDGERKGRTFETWSGALQSTG